MSVALFAAALGMLCAPLPVAAAPNSHSNEHATSAGNGNANGSVVHEYVPRQHLWRRFEVVI
jgi:hypothetical protein